MPFRTGPSVCGVAPMVTPPGSLLGGGSFFFLGSTALLARSIQPLTTALSLSQTVSSCVVLCDFASWHLLQIFSASSIYWHGNSSLSRSMFILKQLSSLAHSVGFIIPPGHVGMCVIIQNLAHCSLLHFIEYRSPECLIRYSQYYLKITNRVACCPLTDIHVL